MRDKNRRNLTYAGITPTDVFFAPKITELEPNTGSDDEALKIINGYDFFRLRRYLCAVDGEVVDGSMGKSMTLICAPPYL